MLSSDTSVEDLFLYQNLKIRKKYTLYNSSLLKKAYNDHQKVIVNVLKKVLSDPKSFFILFI